MSDPSTIAAPDLAAPALALAPAARTSMDVLPSAPLTSFVGREREVASLRELLAATRLLTLTGAGGSGKTRLALELVARVAQEHPGTVAWVELAPFHDGAALPGHVASALGIRTEAGENVDDVLAAVFRDREMLLVLDNCEHMVDACARFAERHLRSARGLRILATSREALGIAGERAWLVPALSLPAADVASAEEALAHSDAVRLFVQRARDVAASFALTDANAGAVARICRQLDGLPLAIELAAARVRVLAPAQIAERLGHAFQLLTTGGRTAIPRHRTLRETIQWSHDLLAPREQALLHRLSVFTGGFTLEAAEAVCGDPPEVATRDGARGALPAADVLDLLAALVDKSLVAMEGSEREPRYRLLETVRQFAAERFAADMHADAVRARHAAFYLAFVEAAEPHVFIADADAEWLARLDAELGNVIAAADWYDGRADGGEAQLRVVAALDWHIYARGTFDLSMRLLRRALARRDDSSPRAVVRALTALAHHAVWTGDLRLARDTAEDALPLARVLGDRVVLAEALAALGAATAFAGDTATALAALTEAEAIDATGHLPALTYILGHRCYAEYRAGDMAASVHYGEALVTELRARGRHGAAAEVYPGIGRALLALGDYERAAQLFAEGVGLTRRYGRIWAMVHNIEALVAVLAAKGDPRRAARLHGAAQGLRDSYGMRLRPYAEDDARAVATLRATLDPADFDALVAEGRLQSIGQTMECAVMCAATAQRLHAALTESHAPPPMAAAAPHAPRTAAGETVVAGPPPALRVHALGPVEVWRDGEPVPASAWKYGKPRELLLYLLAHPDGRTREQIGLAFWPDATAAQVKNSFHVVLHHLRKALGRAELVAFDGERYRVAWELGVELDAQLFEREVREALRALARDPDGDTARLRHALARWRGEFLCEESAGDWHLALRDRLARLHVEALAALGARLEAAGAHAEAVDTYRRLVQADELNEDAYRRLMRCLARAGERTQALRAYERLAALLRADLEAEPEPETVALYDRLRRAEPV